MKYERLDIKRSMIWSFKSWRVSISSKRWLSTSNVSFTDWQPVIRVVSLPSSSSCNRFFPVSLKRLSLRQEGLVTLTVQLVMMITGWLANSDHQRVLILYSLLIVSYTLPVTLAMANLNHSLPRGEEILYILDQKSVRWEGRDSLWQTVSLGLGSSNAISEMSHHNIIISPGLPPFQF